MRTLLLSCCILAVVLAACSDGSLRRPFSLDIEVVDLNGDPVEGLEVRYHIPLDGVPVQAQFKRARMSIQFSIPRAVHGEVNVNGLGGERLRSLLFSDLPAGLHVVSFDGKTDSSETLLGTVPFLVEAIFREGAEGPEIWRDESACVLYTGVDSAQRPSLGETDVDGMLEFDDEGAFPFLSELPVFEGRDFAGQETGEFTFSTNVELLFIDDEDGGFQTEIVDVGAGRNTVEVVWDPIVRAPEEAEGEDGPVQSVVEGPGPAPEFSLDVCYPNPFI